jgi:hypothetical protein
MKQFLCIYKKFKFLGNKVCLPQSKDEVAFHMGEWWIRNPLTFEGEKDTILNLKSLN